MGLKEIRSGKIIVTNQYINKEQVLLPITIYAVVMKILSYFIYQKKAEHLKDIWVKNIDNNTIYFAATLIGQSNNNIKRQQIERMFDKHTKKKAQQEY